MKRAFSAFCLILLLCVLAIPAWAEPPVRGFRSTDLPLPRFVSLKSDRVHARAGPGQRYPIEWVYTRKDLPVEIVQEFEHWRKIRDHEGGESWVHMALLSGGRTVMVRGDDPLDLREGFSGDARLLARAEPGVIAVLRRCVEEWCEISAGGFSGWAQRKSLWGIYESEELN